jgi:hypothetical protein
MGNLEAHSRLKFLRQERLRKASVLLPLSYIPRPGSEIREIHDLRVQLH